MSSFENMSFDEMLASTVKRDATLSLHKIITSDRNKSDTMASALTWNDPNDPIPKVPKYKGKISLVQLRKHEQELEQQQKSDHEQKNNTDKVNNKKRKRKN